MNAWMLVPVVLVGSLAVVVATATVKTQRKLKSLRARGVYPEAGAETDDDVRRLLDAGEKIMAIRCYRAAHEVGLKQAKAAVELIEKAHA